MWWELEEQEWVMNFNQQTLIYWACGRFTNFPDEVARALKFMHHLYSKIRISISVYIMFWNKIIVFPLLKSWNCPSDWEGQLWDETNPHIWCISLLFAPMMIPLYHGSGHTNTPSITLWRDPWDLRGMSHVLSMGHGWKLLVVDIPPPPVVPYYHLSLRRHWTKIMNVSGERPLCAHQLWKFWQFFWWCKRIISLSIPNAICAHF
jgi:hypothetical protein